MSAPYDPADLIEIGPMGSDGDEATLQDPTLPSVPPLAALETDPVTGYILAPLHWSEDHKSATLALDALPRGTAHGPLDPAGPSWADAPQGARNAATKIDGNWIWRLVSGEGWAVRQGKGAERSDGTRPKLQILEPCATVTLRAVGVDEAFPAVTHHVVLAWVRLDRTGSWKAEAGWAGSTEPFLGDPLPGGRVAIRRCWSAGPRRIGVQACRRVLAAAPDARVIDAALAAASAADPDQDVST